MSLFVWPPVTVAGVATEATSLNILAAVDGVESKLDTLHADVQQVAGYIDNIEGLIISSNTKLDTLHTDNTTIIGYIDGIETLIGTTNTNTANTNTKLDTLITRASGNLINVAYDQIVPNLAGATADIYVYKLATVTVKTLTITYADATKQVISDVTAV